jgi:hypothetical protein
LVEQPPVLAVRMAMNIALRIRHRVFSFLRAPIYIRTPG